MNPSSNSGREAARQAGTDDVSSYAYCVLTVLRSLLLTGISQLCDYWHLIKERPTRQPWMLQRVPMRS